MPCQFVQGDLWHSVSQDLKNYNHNSLLAMCCNHIRPKWNIFRLLPSCKPLIVQICIINFNCIDLHRQNSLRSMKTRPKMIKTSRERSTQCHTWVLVLTLYCNKRDIIRWHLREITHVWFQDALLAIFSCTFCFRYGIEYGLMNSVLGRNVLFGYEKYGLRVCDYSFMGQPPAVTARALSPSLVHHWRRT